MNERPRIEIDKDAIRFIDHTGQRNVFFVDVFRGLHNPQLEILEQIKILYDKCVEQDIRPWSEESDMNIHRTINKLNEDDKKKEAQKCGE